MPFQKFELYDTELFAVRGALAAEIAREVDRPDGTERTDYKFLVSAYRRVQSQCEMRVPRDRMHRFHREFLEQSADF